jgi:hypothetical protein
MAMHHVPKALRQATIILRGFAFSEHNTTRPQFFSYRDWVHGRDTSQHR